MPQRIAFNDLRPVREELAAGLREASDRVLGSGRYLVGPELEAFEAAFAAYHGVRYAVGVASGTDAIELALRSLGIGPGDEVVTVAHTAVATVCAIERAGAQPVLVDVDDSTFTMCPAAAAAAIGPRTKALLPVHLYGHPADMDALVALAARHGLALVEDCAQAHGARWRGARVGTFGRLAAFSFYPTKNLGAYGDGGAVLTDDDQLATRLRRLREYGQSERHVHVERGTNSRLDELQAAFLRVKLPRLDAHNDERRRLASIYARELRHARLPLTRGEAEHAFHLFVIRHPERDRLRRELALAGVETLVHYPCPVHRQEAYRHLGMPVGSLPVTERLVGEILSLPLWIGLGAAGVQQVVDALAAAPACA